MALSIEAERHGSAVDMAAVPRRRPGGRGRAQEACTAQEACSARRPPVHTPLQLMPPPRSRAYKLLLPPVLSRVRVLHCQHWLGDPPAGSWEDRRAGQGRGSRARQGLGSPSHTKPVLTSPRVPVLHAMGTGPNPVFHLRTMSSSTETSTARNKVRSEQHGDCHRPHL